MHGSIFPRYGITSTLNKNTIAGIAGAIILFLSPHLLAQEAGLKFERLTAEDGLASNMVYSILQGSHGFMWFGTSEGLNRYDGYNFKAYRHDPSDSTSISDNFIWFECLAEDQDGMIWVGTKAAGLNRFDRTTETFARFRHDPNDPASLSSDNNLTVFVDQSGVLWAGTDKGLNRYDHATETFERFQHDPDDPASLVHNRIWEIHESGRGDEAELWIATHGGLAKFNRKSRTFEHIKLDGLDPNNLFSGPITDIYGDHRGTLWLGSGFGLVKLDLQTMSPEFFRHDPQNSNSLNFNVITDIWQDPGTEGRVLWLTTRRGLNRFDTITETFSHYARDTAMQHGLDAYSVVALHEDNQQRLWIGSHSHGVHKLNPPVRGFSLTKHDPNNRNSMIGYSVNAIYENRAGALWVGTELGLNKWDRDSGKFTHYTFDADLDGVVGANVISGIAEDDAGRLWLGTRGGGLIRFDPQTGEYRQYRHEPTNPHSLASDEIGRVFFDSFGTLWLGTSEHVLSRLLPEDRDVGRFTHFQPQPENKTGLKDQMGFTFLEDSYGKLWIGSFIAGLYRFDRETEQFTAYKHDRNDPASLSSNVIKGMYETRSEHDTILWIGTDNGLNRFYRNSQTFKRIYNKSPGGSDYIISLTGDAGNNLWMQNQKGISKFDTQREIFSNFAGSRGLPADMSNTDGYHKNRQGEIFFGGMGGMIYFHPDSISSNPHLPPVVLTDFKILNEPAELDSSITVKKRVDLAHDQNFFSFEFAALDYTDPKKNQYAYKLEGLDPDWIESGNRRFANYTAVPPGRYTFRVKGSNNDGLWNEQGVMLAISIRPPWWQSGWAYGSYLLLLAAALYAWRRFELRRVQLRNELKSRQFEAEKLKEVDRLKSRFFASISHEFRTPLTLILGPVEKWLSHIQQAEMRADFDIVQRNAHRLRQLIDQLLDLSKLEAGKMTLHARPENMVDLVRMITMTFESLAKQKGIELQFHATEKEIIAYVEREKLETILTNLLSNAFKFTGEGGTVVVALAVAVGKKKLSTATATEIRVSDTGIGIPEDQLDKVFDRFHRVDQSAAHGGTGIGLALTKELVELHHGEINVESEVGKGSTFIIRLPLGKNHLKPEEIGARGKGQETIDHGAAEPLIQQSTDPPIHDRVSSDQDRVMNDESERSGDSDHSGQPVLLIVEDNADMRAYMRGYLENDYQILEAEDGVRGFEQALKHAPDLIISDVMMPEMDGFALCEKLKTDEHTSHIPVILLTARASGESKIEGLETGADDYLTKPFDAKELHVRVKNLIEQRRRLQERFRRELVIEPAQITVTSMDEAFLEKVMAAVEAHIDDPSFATDDLARAAAIGRRQLNRKLRALTGLSVREFIRTIRLKRAAQLLQQRAGTVTEIAYQVGFNSIAHFAKVFREQFGVAPSEFSGSGKSSGS